MKKQKEFFGFGSIKKLSNVLHDNKIKKALLVHDKSSYDISGARNAIDSVIVDFDITAFSDFDPNPKLEQVEKGIELLKNNSFDIVIAIGGGSTIDMAKLINGLGFQSGNPREYILNKKNMEKNPLPLVAIPTTAGTGAEATHFAVVYVGGIKYSLASEKLLPDYAFLDPTFTLNLPKYITACSGMDALSQAIEAYWSVNSTDESKEYSKKAIELILPSLESAVNDPTLVARESMLLASHYSGKAINIAKTTAPHALSYKITSEYGIPHGHAVSLTLAEFLLFNSKVNALDTTDKRGMNYVRKSISDINGFLGGSSSSEAYLVLKDLMKKIGLSTSLEDLKITEKNKIMNIINSVNKDRLKNNPREISYSKMLDIIMGIK